MERKDLTATSWATSRLTAAALGALGVFFLLRPDWLGWDALAGILGGEVGVLACGVGAAFLVLASLSLEKHALRVRCAELMEGLNQLLYGKDYSRDREAIGILLRSLDGKDPAARETAHRHLVRLTGQNFAPDPAVWRAWWATYEKTWAARRTSDGQGPGGGGPSGGGASAPTGSESP
jgi:hypothetical protein